MRKVGANEGRDGLDDEEEERIEWWQLELAW